MDMNAVVTSGSKQLCNNNKTPHLTTIKQKKHKFQVNSMRMKVKSDDISILRMPKTLKLQIGLILQQFVYKFSLTPTTTCDADQIACCERETKINKN